MKRPLYIANWKMNKTAGQTRHWFASAATEPWDPAACEVAVAPPLTSLREASEFIRGALGAGVNAGMVLAAQTCHWEPSGAFTGEVSAPMLADLSVRYVLAGHSERRQHFGETDERVGRKVQAIVEAGMIAVLCVGETQPEREAGRTAVVIESQLRRGIERLTPPDPDDVVVAYEPVWAIGTGLIATTAQVAEAHTLLRTIMTAAGGAEKAGRVKILYGGSVNTANVAAIAALSDVDGALVGGASLEPDLFFELVRRGCAARGPAPS